MQFEGADCDEPPPLANGSATYTRTRYPTNASYACDLGYLPEDPAANNVVKCQITGNWEPIDSTLVCSGKYFIFVFISFVSSLLSVIY